VAVSRGSMMADQLTSVRFPQETLATLKLLAELHDGNVAVEIRAAVEKHIAECTSAPDFGHQVATKQRERVAQTEELTAQLLAAAGAVREP
jgi:predicted DNA-binding protein